MMDCEQQFSFDQFLLDEVDTGDDRLNLRDDSLLMEALNVFQNENIDSPVKVSCNHSFLQEIKIKNEVIGLEPSSNIKNKKRKNNPDAAEIAAATEESLKLLQLDPNSKDGKLKKRQIRNRMSAQYHRDRKNAYIQELEAALQIKSNEILKLVNENNFLKCENNSLRKELTKLDGIPRIESMIHEIPKVLPGTPDIIAPTTDNDDSEDSSSLCSGYKLSKVFSKSEEDDKIRFIERLKNDVSTQQISKNSNPFLHNSTVGGLPGIHRSNISKYLSIVSMVCLCAMTIISQSGFTLPLRTQTFDEPIISNRRLLDSEPFLNEQQQPTTTLQIKNPAPIHAHHRNLRINENNQTTNYLDGIYQRNESNVDLKYLQWLHSTFFSFNETFLNHTKSTSFLSNSTSKMVPLKFIGNELVAKHFDHQLVASNHFSKLPSAINWDNWARPASFTPGWEKTVQSYSTVVLSQGSILFDPSLVFHNVQRPAVHLKSESSNQNGKHNSMNSKKIGNSLVPTAVGLAEVRETVQSTEHEKGIVPTVHDRAVVVLEENRNFQSSTHNAVVLKLPSDDKVISDEERLINSNSDDHLGSTVQIVLNATALNPGTTTAGSISACEDDNAIKNFLSDSHILTIQLPLSMIRTGTNWVDSRNDSEETIRNLFGVKTVGSVDHDDVRWRINSTLDQNSIELSCIILGAKLV